jgi:hypothetical protein
MSAATKQALEAAIDAHVNDECEGEQVVTAYVFGAAISTFSEVGPKSSYFFASTNEQPAHITRGMAQLVTEWADMSSIFGYEDDEDD